MSCTDNAPKTNSTIQLTDSNNKAVSGVIVYVYTNTHWQVIGDNTLFADGQSASDNNGKTVFSDMEYAAAFITSNQETFTFSAHYSLGGVNKTKTKSITFSKGDSKTDTMILN